MTKKITISGIDKHLRKNIRAYAEHVYRDFDKGGYTPPKGYKTWYSYWNLKYNPANQK